jgi:hypothetical protein
VAERGCRPDALFVSIIQLSPEIAAPILHAAVRHCQRYITSSLSRALRENPLSLAKQTSGTRSVYPVAHKCPCDGPHLQSPMAPAADISQSCRRNTPRYGVTCAACTAHPPVPEVVHGAVPSGEK